MEPSRDEQLDIWIHSVVFRKDRARRFTTPPYTRYLNRAFQAMECLDYSYELSRSDGPKWTIDAEGQVIEVHSFEDLPYAICRLLYLIETGVSWPCREP